MLDLRAHKIVISRGEAEQILKVRGEKQIFGPLQPALGKSLAEDVDVRWQADVIDLKNQLITSKSDDTVSYTAILVCINCFTRVLYARPLTTKTQEEVRKQMRSILGEAPHTPQVISTDNGLEFKGEVSEYLESKGIVQRFRSVGDIKALGLVDRAIQQLRLKIAEMMARSEWGLERYAAQSGECSEQSEENPSAPRRKANASSRESRGSLHAARGPG